MGTLKKLGIGAALALACLVLAAVVLAVLASRWEARVQPLSPAEVRSLGAVAPDLPHEEGEERSSEAAGLTAQPAGPDRTKSGPPKTMRLASCPTKEQLDALPPGAEGLSGVARIKLKANLIEEKIIGLVGYKCGLDAGLRYSVLGRIGDHYFFFGYFDTARSYLQEAIRVEKDECQRRYWCMRQAWLEEDPEVAVALLDESLSGPLSKAHPDDFESLAQFNALDLCVVTGSEELAEYYYLRYRDSWPKWMAGRYNLSMRCHPETLTWLQNREAKGDTK
jgi:hypothetical protein